MTWNVQFSRKAFKQTLLLDERLILVLQVLVDNLKLIGPAPGKHWHHYGKLHGKQNEDKRHCHSYVCCWEVKRSLNEIEIYYVGTHEKAPY